jgi:FkbM family methyltransferase
MRHHLIRLFRNLIFRDELGLIIKYISNFNKKSTLIDVGAATGDFALPFAEKGWQVVAFEPEPQNFNDLVLNLQNFANVKCIAKAISDTSGQVQFYVSSTHGGIHSLKPFHSTHCLSLVVDAVRLDEILSDMRVDQVNVLKIDVEGADFMALKSFDFSNFHPDLIMCEFMDERSREYFGYTHHDMVAYMNRFGYATFVSEWGTITEYARDDRLTRPPKFLCCELYPLNHTPIWGNLIFIPNNQKEYFEKILSSYIIKLKFSNFIVRMIVFIPVFFNHKWRRLIHGQ